MTTATHTTRRRILTALPVAGIAAALPVRCVVAEDRPAPYPDAEVSPLSALVERHRAVYAAWINIVPQHDEAEKAFEEKNRIDPIVVDISLPNQSAGDGTPTPCIHVQHPHAEFAAGKIRADCASWRRVLGDTRPNARMWLDAVDRAERDGLRRAAAVRRQWFKRREAHGVAQLQRDCNALDKAETEAAIEIVAYPCRTIEEVWTKAKYIKDVDLLENLYGRQDFVDVLVNSLLPRDA